MNNSSIIFTLLILFLGVNLFSQDIDYLKSQDTLYISFEKGKPFEKNIIDFPNEKQGNTINYKLYLYSNMNTANTIDFWQYSYLNNDKYKAGIKSEIRTIDRNFIRKNKKRIINLKFINRYGKDNFLFNLGGKTFYIIDRSGVKIVLREVILLNVVPFQQ